MIDAQKLSDLVRDGVRRKLAMVGRQRLVNMTRRGLVGMVWVSEDLSRHAYFKLIRFCAEHEIPLLRLGPSEDLAEATGIPGTKVVILKKTFHGLARILRDLD